MIYIYNYLPKPKLVRLEWN